LIFLTGFRNGGLAQHLGLVQQFETADDVAERFGTPMPYGRTAAGNERHDGLTKDPK